MPKTQEKPSYTWIKADFAITYRLADSATAYAGHCLSVSAAGIIFISKEPIAVGKAVVLSILVKNSTVPPMIAFIEVIKTTPKKDGYEIITTIKGIKAI
ncbi:MAG: PilZ domain-containing protein [Methylococcaceae bacterium]